MELKIFDAFRKHEASLTLGVIPYICARNVHDPSLQDNIPLTKKKKDILKTGFSDGILDIALHGFSHQTIGAKYATEFSGLNYNNQVEKLAKGKEFIENMIDAPIRIFIPPWNRYDLNTLRALEETGFSTISANKAGDVTHDCRLNFLPCSCGVSQLRDAVEAARISSDTQPVIVVMFHAYDFKEVDERRGNITYKEFCELLKWLKLQEHIRLLSISQATQAIHDLSVQRFLINQRIHSRAILLPSFLRKGDSLLVYRETDAFTNTRLKLFGFYTTMMVMIFVLSLILGTIVFSRSTLIMISGTFGSIVLLITIFMYIFNDMQMGIKFMIVSAGIVGTSIGLCVSSLYLNRKNRANLRIIQ